MSLKGTTFRGAHAEQYTVVPGREVNTLMAALDPAAIALLVKMCAPPNFDPRIIDAIAQHESGRNPLAISPPNRNGTVDYGLMQINSANFARFGLTPSTALNGCGSIGAAARHLIASGGPDAVKPATVNALLRAFQAYNPGDPAYKAEILELLAKHSSSELQVERSPSDRIENMVEQTATSATTLADQTPVRSLDRMITFAMPPERKR